MSLGTTARLVLIVSAVWFNAWFAVLAKTFSYPDILREPSDEILERSEPAARR
jgi:hypothetical protein